MTQPPRAWRFAVNVTPKPGILDPQGRAVERSLPHLGVETVRDVRIGRRVELTVAADDEGSARAVVERVAGEVLSNPLIEAYGIELIAAVAAGAGESEALAVGPAGTAGGGRG